MSDHKIKLYLYIDDTGYRIEVVPHCNANATRCLSLTKKDGEIYHVHYEEFGLSCTCGDFVFRHQHTEQKCKHCEALREVGLI